MSKKVACDQCGRVHIDKVHKTCKGYVCSDCVRETWGKKSFKEEEIIITVGNKTDISCLIKEIRKE